MMTIVFRSVFLALIIFTNTSGLLGQWVQTKGPYSGNILCVAVSTDGAGGTNLFVGTLRDGLYLSTNTAATWTPVNLDPLNKDVLSLAAIPDGAGGTTVLASTSGRLGGGLFRSTDNGGTWAQISSAPSPISSFAVTPKPTEGTNLFAGAYGFGVYLSTDYGTSWSQVNSGLTDLRVRSLAVDPN
jgi:photosystem II stability/assembly factor-like uncharacterized protein